jgi:hypothetical protein
MPFRISRTYSGCYRLIVRDWDREKRFNQEDFFFLDEKGFLGSYAKRDFYVI